MSVMIKPLFLFDLRLDIFCYAEHFFFTFKTFFFYEAKVFIWSLTKQFILIFINWKSLELRQCLTNRPIVIHTRIEKGKVEFELRNKSFVACFDPFLLHVIDINVSFGGHYVCRVQFAGREKEKERGRERLGIVTFC